MQNGLRTSGIGWESMRMRFWCMRFYFINFMDENDVICLRCYLDSKWIWKCFWCGRVWGQLFRRFSNTCACVFQQQLQLNLRFAELHFIFWKLWECFEMFLDVLEFATTMRMRRRCFWFCLEVNSNKLNSPNMVVRSLRRTFTFCACRRCHFNSTEQLKQEKTKLCLLHVQDNLAGQTACFLCVSCMEKEPRVLQWSRREFGWFFIPEPDESHLQEAGGHLEAGSAERQVKARFEASF